MQSEELSLLLLPICEDDHVAGPPTASATFVEYGDYECAECGKLFWELRKVREILGENLRIVYRHYPLSGIHRHAQEAGEAAEAAGAQGKFWEMHDLLFENQSALKRHDLIDYGKLLALDVDRFRRELDQHVYAEAVRENFRRGVQNGVYGTPGLFLNGVRYHGRLEKQDLLAQLTKDR